MQMRCQQKVYHSSIDLSSTLFRRCVEVDQEETTHTGQQGRSPQEECRWHEGAVARLALDFFLVSWLVSGAA